MDFRPVTVDYSQLELCACGEAEELPLWSVGDDLLQVCGGSTLHGMTGLQFGEVQLRAEARSGPPDPDEWQQQGWQGVSEATVWCDGRLSPAIHVGGLLGTALDPMPELAQDRGLHRVQLRCRHRAPEWAERPEPEVPEQYELLVWPVHEDVGHRTVADDGVHTDGWQPDPGRSAGWALATLVDRAQPDPLRDNLSGADSDIEDDQHPRVETTRSVLLPRDAALEALRSPERWLLEPLTDDPHRPLGILPAGPVDLVLEPNASIPDLGRSFSVTWRSTGTAVVPDDAVTDLRLELGEADGDRVRLTLRHLALRARDAVLLGMVWEAVLSRLSAGAESWPWAADLTRRQAARDAEAQAEADQLLGVEQELARDRLEFFGSERLVAQLDRFEGSNVIGLVTLDQALVAALADTTPDRQRAVALLAARRAVGLAGLAGLDWVDAALRAAEAGDPLPPPFDHPATVFERLDEPGVPHTTVALLLLPWHPEELRGAPASATHAAVPAILALAFEEPLAAATDALWSAAHTAGPDYPALFAEVRAAFPDVFGAG
jgi:hypothetical protein